MKKNIYVLDSDTLITSSRDFYSNVFCPGFWDFLTEANTKGELVSIDKVKREIEKGEYDDYLKEWARLIAPNEFFRSTDKKEIIDCYKMIVNWANAQSQYQQNAKAELMSDKADAWLIAYALANLRNENMVVCTFEKYHADTKKRIPIPNVCKAFNVEYRNIYYVLHNIKPQFVLGPKE